MIRAWETDKSVAGGVRALAHKFDLERLFCAKKGSDLGCRRVNLGYCRRAKRLPSPDWGCKGAIL